MSNPSQLKQSQSLTDEQKREIIISRLSPMKLSEIYNVSQNTIYKTLRERNKKNN